MSKKPSTAKSSPGKSRAAPPLRDNLKDSAQQIWLAGLGAFNKAQQEGGKMFDALVQEGLTMQRKAQSAAEVKLTEVNQRMTTMAHEFGSKAAGQWDKLEGLFEERVARALHRLGMPSAHDVHALTRRLEALESAGKAKPAKKAAARPASAKKTAKPATKKASRPAARKKSA